jgi:hypothetical protein
MCLLAHACKRSFYTKALKQFGKYKKSILQFASPLCHELTHSFKVELYIYIYIYKLIILFYMLIICNLTC